jgi:hypothetical protein
MRENTPQISNAMARWRAASETGLIFLVFFIQGAWLAPEVNEPHYLSKATHYWRPDWCANDFFCNTADAHQVFYWTFGWLSLWLPLPALAWTGRMLTWSLLAWSWRRLSWAIVPVAWYSVLSAALMVVLNDRCQMAGEWIIGGIEAKGFAYVFVLLGLESLIRARWRRALLLLGAASAFHVIIGGWSVVAAGMAWLASPDRPPLRKLILPLAGGLLVALAGLLPALALTRGVDTPIVAEANRIYVFERLPHHLVPQRFPPQFIERHLLLIGVLVALMWFAPRDSRWIRLRSFVAASVGLSTVGIVLALCTADAPDLAAALLRYYWFRLSDVLVPIGVALAGIDLLARWQLSRPAWHAVALAISLLVAGLPLADTIWRRHEYGRPPADANLANLAEWQDWKKLCTWISAETPADAVFLTPRLAQTFRWYAGRAEVVSRKDIPQDARGIVEWWRRMNLIHGAEPGSLSRWRPSLAQLGAQRLQDLGTQFGADYVVTSAYPALNLPRVGPSSPSFAIYRLSESARSLQPNATDR